MPKKPDVGHYLSNAAASVTAALAFWRDGDLRIADRHLRQAVAQLVGARVEFAALLAEENGDPPSQFNEQGGCSS
jgi:hypothetical protein